MVVGLTVKAEFERESVRSHTKCFGVEQPSRLCAFLHVASKSGSLVLMLHASQPHPSACWQATDGAGEEGLAAVTSVDAAMPRRLFFAQLTPQTLLLLLLLLLLSLDSGER